MNKIDMNGWLDEKLARGMSREILRNTTKAWDRLRLRDGGRRGGRNGRLDFARQMKEFMIREKIYLGIAYEPDLMRISFGTVFSDQIQADWQALSIEEMSFDFTAERTADVLRTERVCMIDVHAIRRLIERTGVRGQDAVLNAFKPTIEWCQALRRGCRPRAAILPLDEHLVAVKGTRMHDGFLTPRIVTFLDRRNMTDANIAIRRRLEPLTQDRPAFPSHDGDISLDQEERAKLAWACGADWEARTAGRSARTGAAAVHEPRL